jgi:hypothetical protein
MTKIHHTLLFILLLLFCSCGRSLQRDIQISSTGFKLHGMTGAQMELQVSNSGTHIVGMEQLQFTLSDQGRELLTATLIEPIEIEAHSHSTFRTLWRIRTPQPFALYQFMRKITPEQAEQAVVRTTGVLRMDKRRRNFSRSMSFSSFLDTFGVGLEDIRIE